MKNDCTMLAEGLNVIYLELVESYFAVFSVRKISYKANGIINLFQPTEPYYIKV